MNTLTHTHTALYKRIFSQYSCLVSKLADKAQSGLEDIDKSDELVSIWAKSGTKEVRHTLPLDARGSKY